MERKKSAVALGLFDGVHLGHRAVLAEARAQSGNGLAPAAYTFTPESALYKPDSTSGYIYGAWAKMWLLGQCGVRTEYSNFGVVKSLSGEEFALRILHERLNAAYVCCGKDFRFGSGASCGIDELSCFGKRFGFEVRIVEDILFDNSVVSSSRIRKLLKEGSIERANELLGHPYIVSGPVEDGNHIGRTIDFPTINQSFAPGQLVPAYGVYSGSACVDGVVYRTITNIGVKPTIAGERSPLAETHILGFSGNLYGRTVRVKLNSFIRSEKKFSSVDELKKQIQADISAAYTI